MVRKKKREVRRFIFELSKVDGKKKISLVDMPELIYAKDIDNIYCFCKDLFNKIKTDGKKEDNNEISN